MNTMLIGNTITKQHMLAKLVCIESCSFLFQAEYGIASQVRKANSNQFIFLIHRATYVKVLDELSIKKLSVEMQNLQRFVWN